MLKIPQNRVSINTHKNIFMKKFYLLFTFMLTLLLSACTSSLFDKTVKAYEESTKELASASSNEDCDRIHDELMEKLYKITKEYPDWKEIIEKEGENSEAVKNVTKAYEAWNEALKDATTDNHYMVMTYCNFPNAIEQIEGKAPSSKSSVDKDEDNSDDFTTSSSDTNVDEMLDSYDEYVNKLADFYNKLKDLEPGSEDYMQVLGEAQELEGSYKDLLDKCKTSVSEFTPEQMQRYTEITKRLTETMKSL